MGYHIASKMLAVSQQVLGFTWILLLAGASLIVPNAIYAFYKALRDPLRGVPGPFTTRFTRLWLARQYALGDFHKTNLNLHKRYGTSMRNVTSPVCPRSHWWILGPIVRLAPGQYSVDHPEASKVLYGPTSQMHKVNKTTKRKLRAFSYSLRL